MAQASWMTLLSLFIYILPGAPAACPQIPSDSLQPREQGSHFYQWEDPESADSEGLAGGNGREADRKWKRAPGLAVFNGVQAGPSTHTAFSFDLFVGLCSWWVVILKGSRRCWKLSLGPRGQGTEWEWGKTEKLPKPKLQARFNLGQDWTSVFSGSLAALGISSLSML